MTLASSNLRLLAIGTDPALLRPRDDAFGDAHQRQLRYASILRDYHMVVRSLSGSSAPIHHGAGFTVHPSGSRSRVAFPLDAYRVGSRLQRATRFDLVSTEDPMLCGLAGYLLRRRYGIPLSVQIAGDMIDSPHWLRERRVNPLLNALAKRLVRSADSVRVVSERERAKLIRLGVTPERVWNIGWISDFERFGGIEASDLRERLLGGCRHLLLFMGRLVLQKDLPTLLRAMAAIRVARDDVRLVVAGDGPERASAEALAAGLGIADRVTFVGTVVYPDVPRYYAACDVVLASTVYEGNSRVLAEAGAAGRPVITNDVSGAADTVTEDETGFILPVGDAEGMARRALELLDDQGRAIAMGARASEHVRQLYGAESLLPRFAEFWAMTAQTR
ncbi:MAG: glycosyltransferase family 4 protein [Chloroflexota bacterium]